MNDPIKLKIEVNINETVPLQLYKESQHKINLLQLKIGELNEIVEENNEVILNLQEDLQK